MVKEYENSTRYRAIGMLEAGQRQVEVSRALGIPVRTLRGWKKRHDKGQSLENRVGRGRKSKISRVAKIVISKSMYKKGQSTRALAKRLTAAGHEVSHMTVQRHLKDSLDAHPFKLQKIPKLTEKHV